ncbi:amylo-alpha-1,6-glucosidase [Arenibacter palladensis]|uniref:MGH1-like glycoside hydrolase domain-containing protein n=1 Tax=Arenibacter palladensis TaxID=237373 RepID=UPI002FD459E4
MKKQPLKSSIKIRNRTEYALLFLLVSVLMVKFSPCQAQDKTGIFSSKDNIIPALSIGNAGEIKKEFVFQMALGDLYSNIRLHKSGLLDRDKLCFMAGINYNRPWTRDAAINIWNGGGLIFPEVAKNTLLSVIAKDQLGNVVIAGQYWDKIIWAVGLWNYYLYTGDLDMLEFGYDIVQRTFIILESEEFDKKNNLFRGAAVYGDGVAAYPEVYTRSENNNTYSGIHFWPKENPKLRASAGHGIPMQALSTNCLYYGVYTILSEMAKELGVPPNQEWSKKAKKLKESINKRFWNPKKNTYDYLIDPFGGSDAQEGMGISFAIMFGVADPKQTEAMLRNTHVEPAGIPVVWPSFPRYENEERTSYGRHSGTVWPHVQSFWAYSAAINDRMDLFNHEYNALTANVWRDKQFVEIYHPKTGKKYGGIQENNSSTWNLTKSQNRQTWSATGYLRMVFMGIVGMRFDTDGLSFSPLVSEELGPIRLENIRYRNTVLNISIKGSGNTISKFLLNGVESKPFLPVDLKGEQNIMIILEN